MWNAVKLRKVWEEPRLSRRKLFHDGPGRTQLFSKWHHINCELRCETKFLIQRCLDDDCSYFYHFPFPWYHYILHKRRWVFWKCEQKFGFRLEAYILYFWLNKCIMTLASHAKIICSVLYLPEIYWAVIFNHRTYILYIFVKI